MKAIIKRHVRNSAHKDLFVLFIERFRTRTQDIETKQYARGVLICTINSYEGLGNPMDLINILPNLAEKGDDDDQLDRYGRTHTASPQRKGAPNPIVPRLFIGSQGTGVE